MERGRCPGTQDRNNHVHSVWFQHHGNLCCLCHPYTRCRYARGTSCQRGVHGTVSCRRGCCPNRFSQPRCPPGAFRPHRVCPTPCCHLHCCCARPWVRSV